MFQASREEAEPLHCDLFLLQCEVPSPATSLACLLKRLVHCSAGEAQHRVLCFRCLCRASSFLPPEAVRYSFPCGSPEGTWGCVLQAVPTGRSAGRGHRVLSQVCLLLHFPAQLEELCAWTLCSARCSVGCWVRL